MKKTVIIGGLSLFMSGLCTNVAKVCLVEGPLAEEKVALNNKSSTNEHPTKEEWLEVFITHRIKAGTDVWRQRIAVWVAIVPEHQVIAITLTSANGQEEITQSAKNSYLSHVEYTVKVILKEYGWAQNYKLVVQYV
jgi:hypothetical protein